MAESTRSIITAAVSNLAIAAAKFLGAALTGSSSMLSEGVHSVVDTLNQGLLLVGLTRARKPPDMLHPFGYGREIYFFAFVVSLLIFFAGGAYSLYEGIEKIHHPEVPGEAEILGVRLPGVIVNVAILLFAIGAEGYSLYVAVSSLPKGSGSPLTAIRRSKDPTLFVVIAEDTAAVVGLLVALVAVVGSALFTAPALDAVGSIGIALVLFAMAGFLILETHGLLIGEAADPDVVRAIADIAAGEPGVRHVNEILTQHLGPHDVLVNLSIDVDNTISGNSVEQIVGRIEAALRDRQPSVRRLFVETQTQAQSDASNAWRRFDAVR